MSASNFYINGDTIFKLINYAAWCPGQYSVATLTPLLSLLTVVGLELWRASGIYPKGNYPKSTNLLLLNWRYSLLEGAWVLAFESWEKNALIPNALPNDLVTRFILSNIMILVLNKY